MTECTCFSSALQISEHLQRTESGLAYASFDQVLTVARQASAVCQQYAYCPSCADPSYFTIYIVILRKVTACYAHLIRASNLGQSPGTASTSSAGSGSSASHGSITRLRIGAFEVEAPLDEQTRAIILRTELRRASEAAFMLEAAVGTQSMKPALLHSDEVTLHYHRTMIASLREEIANLEQYVRML